MNTRCLWLRIRRRQFIPSAVSLLTIIALLLVNIRHNYRPERAAVPSAAVHFPFHKHDIDCSAIYDMDPMEVGKSLAIRKAKTTEATVESLAKMTENCVSFTKMRGYDGVCTSDMERDFPLAYSLVVHKSEWMVERLLRAIYSPSNVYCIHYDQKSPPEFTEAMEGLARCLPNVIIASKRESVVYASISRLQADLNCLQDLRKSQVNWRYVINLCGQDFPLKSNIELVSELKSLNGSNMLETSRPSERKKNRFSFHHELKEVSFEYQKMPVETSLAKSPPPHGIEVFIGSAYFVLSREFITHMQQSVVVKDFLDWSTDTYSPDEHFWATLVRVPGFPGEVPRSKPDVTDLMSKTRLVKWAYLEGELYPACTGQHVRSVCIYGSGEMNWLLNYGHWFANKFDPKVDPVLMQCLEEKLDDKRRSFLSSNSMTCHKG